MRKKMIYALLLLLLVGAGWFGRLTWVSMGRMPRGERLERIKQSPRWHDGTFQNAHTTPQLTGDKNVLGALWSFMFGKVDNLRPSKVVPTVKTDLLGLDRKEEVVVWLGHSSLFVQTGGKRYLFDPVLTSKLPVKLFMRPFLGADAYTPEDIPEVDYLIITHDHWDHLDYATVKALRKKVGTVVCGLGIGENFEYWRYEKERVHDMDWGDTLKVDSETTLRCLPARHFSGRFGNANKSLWASYLIDGPRRIYVTGDGGYDTHFADIGRQYPDIDLAIMENGQYSADWKYIHMLPDLLPKAIDEVNPRRVLTYHHSKFALAKHAWTEPLEKICQHAAGKPWKLLTPRIGERVELQRDDQVFEKWWK